jgi:phosphomannomutase
MGTAAFEHGRLGAMMQALEDQLPGALLDRSDGLKLSMPEGWIHVRASNTEPLLRIAVETRSETATNELYERLEQLFARQVG